MRAAARQRAGQGDGVAQVQPLAKLFRESLFRRCVILAGRPGEQANEGRVVETGTRQGSAHAVIGSYKLKRRARRLHQTGGPVSSLVAGGVGRAAYGFYFRRTYMRFLVFWRSFICCLYLFPFRPELLLVA
jgi:hypothetical protein